MFQIVKNKQVGVNFESHLLAGELKDVGEYGAVPLKGMMSGHQGCSGCAELMSVGQVLKALKLLDKHIVASIGTGCNEVVTTQNTSCWGSVSVDHNNFPNTASTLSGNIAAYRALVKAGKLKEGSVLNVGIAGDGATYDIGLQALLAWIARGEDGVYICLNNEAYMNTGIQGSGATPYGANTTTTPHGNCVKGNQRTQQYLPDLVLAAGARYVATATPYEHRDLMLKVQKAALIPGPTVVEVYCVCPEGWKTQTDFFHKVSEMALNTGVFMLYEVENDVEAGIRNYQLTYRPKVKEKIENYLKLQGRFKNIMKETEMIRKLQKQVDARWKFWEEG